MEYLRLSVTAKIVLLWGAPAGGKSSIARELVAMHRHKTGRSLPWMSTDAISRTMVGDEFVPELRPIIYDGLLTLASGAVDAGLDVILDGNYVQSAHREKVCRLAESKGALLVSALVHCQLTSRLARNRSRPQSELIPDAYVEMAHNDAFRAQAEATTVIDTDVLSPSEAAAKIWLALETDA